jgi:hypothetical protein
MLQVYFVPGAVLHYHATDAKTKYGEILVLGSTQDYNVVLITKNPFPSHWPAEVGHALAWMIMNTDIDERYHPAELCSLYWSKP